MRLYRAVVPQRWRRRLFTLIPPSRRLRLARRLIRRSRARQRAAAGAWVRVRVAEAGRAGVPALVQDDATPVSVRQYNLDQVVRAFDEAEIPYFCLPTYGELRSAVAVPVTARERALRVLRASPGLADAQLFLISSKVSSSGPELIARVFRPVTDPARILVLGGRYACEVEFWQESHGRVFGPRPNPVSMVAPTTCELVDAAGSAFSRFVPHLGDSSRYRTRPDFAPLEPEQITFPIDAVYTWVDGSDPDWRRRKNEALREQWPGELSEIAANDSRYANRDELRYSLRSLVCFAPWIRHIYLVTDDQAPAWLDLDHPGITLVRHREIFGDTGRLPTFNSHAIESRLHRIPGLAEHFLYLNDDMFFGRPVQPNVFFHGNGIAKFFMSHARLDLGPPTVDDPPVTAAGKNNRRHIAEQFGRTITRKMRHVPYPLLRSVLEEIEETLPKEVLGTADHQFRHPEDISIPSSLQHYWSFLTRRAVPGTIGYAYVDLAHQNAPMQLARLLVRRQFDVFCLNDTDPGQLSAAEQHALLADFLPAYFPFRAPFELPDRIVAQRSRYSATELATELAAGLPAPQPLYEALRS